MSRILFVDDEENVLQGLKVMLRTMRSSWDMVFKDRGEDALAELATGPPFDVIVSDMHMPGMHGAEFLKKAVEIQPNSVRVVLTGNLDTKTMTTASSFAHQVLAKPCDPHHLRSVLSRALSLKDRLPGCSLRDRLMGMGVLPSVPVVYWEIMNEINSPEPSAERAGCIIAKDPGLSAKVLQIANAHTGPANRISNIVQAATFLGLENLKSFVLMAEMFSQAKDKPLAKGFSLDELWQHGLSVGQYAKTITEAEGESQSIIDDAYTAGLLHDIGLLILASQLPAEFNRAIEHARNGQYTLVEAERELFGANHAEIGGFLLDLWGLPSEVVDAITWHYYPSSAPVTEFSGKETCKVSPLTAVHVANFFCEDEQDEAGSGFGKAQVDSIHLEEIGLSGRLSVWWDLCNR